LLELMESASNSGVMEARMQTPQAPIASDFAADSQETRGIRPWAMDPALAERLWTLSEKITGLAIA
jgi:hypothetical protein